MTIDAVICSNSDCDGNNFDAYIFYSTWYHLILECKTCYSVMVFQFGDSYSRIQPEDAIRRLFPELLVKTVTSKIG